MGSALEDLTVESVTGTVDHVEIVLSVVWTSRPPTADMCGSWRDISVTSVPLPGRERDARAHGMGGDNVTEPQPATLLHWLIIQRDWTIEDAAREFEVTAKNAGISATMSPRHLGRMARVETAGRSPSAPTRRVLRLLFDRSVDELLSPPPPGLTNAPGRHAGLGDEVDMAAERARAFGERSRSRLSDEALEQIHDEVRSLATDYPQRPVLQLLPNLIKVQGDLMDLIETPQQHPTHLRQLYFLTAVTSGLVAKSSHDLGRTRAAMTQARTALLCAEQAGHDGLRAWINGLESMFSYWSGRPRDAVRYAQRGAEFADRAGSTAAVWLPASEARAWAALGRTDETKAAIGRAESALDRAQADDLDDLGGLCTFSRSRQLYYAADALTWLPTSGADAERYSEAAIAAYASREDDWAFGDEAGAMSDLAVARIQRQDLDGAIEAVRPVLELPPDQRIHGIAASVKRVHGALTTSGIRSAEAIELQDGFEAFHRTALPAVEQ